MSDILGKYSELQDKPFKYISKKGKIKSGLIDNFDTPIWVEKFGIMPIKCEPEFVNIEDFNKNKPKDEILEKPLPPVNPEGSKEEKDSVFGVPIIKLEMGAIEGIDNPITIDEVKSAIKYFKLPKEHFAGLKEIVISNELPGKKWAFGTYNIRKKGKELIDNRITLFAQRTEVLNGEKRYIVTPSNISGELHLTSSRFHYEILGDTLIHEIGHHYDLWINESSIGTSGWVVRAEQFAERYSKSFTAIRRRSEDFLGLMVQYGDDDNKQALEKIGEEDPNSFTDVDLTSKI